MAAAADLVQAANDSAENLNALYILGPPTLKTRLTTFGATCLALFPDQEPNGRPSMNWCVLIQALARSLSASVQTSPADFLTAVQYIYRMCLMTNVLQTQSLITPTQGNAVLAAYNANF